MGFCASAVNLFEWKGRYQRRTARRGGEFSITGQFQMTPWFHMIPSRGGGRISRVLGRARSRADPSGAFARQTPATDLTFCPLTLWDVS